MVVAALTGAPGTGGVIADLRCRLSATGREVFDGGGDPLDEPDRRGLWCPDPQHDIARLLCHRGLHHCPGAGRACHAPWPVRPGAITGHSHDGIDRAAPHVQVRVVVDVDGELICVHRGILLWPGDRDEPGLLPWYGAL